MGVFWNFFEVVYLSVNVNLVNLVEDFYDLDPTPDEEDQQVDYFKEDPEYSLPTDFSALHEELLKDNSNITMRSVKCKPPEVKNCDCNCDQTCKKNQDNHQPQNMPQLPPSHP